MYKIEEIKKMEDRYELLELRELNELASTGVLLRHKKSGARVALLLNEDENKVFSIGFRTPPADSTGVAHIVEHTVLCGSERFPGKDPFVELAKGSLNTFLNAMTFPDKTLYPVASCNDKDFANLMHVYLDAVFFPAIYRKKEIFLQEGWHYELSEPDEGERRLSINGVVYNEMKGALSSPDDLIYDKISQALFPDTAYREESGGDPERIPELTYEDFLAFHQRYYHPSNSYVYLYGNLDAGERLDFLDREYLSRFDYLAVDSEIALQPPVLAEREEFYPAGGEDEDGEWLSYNVAAGQSSDLLLTNALQILEYVLVDRPGAPVKQALMDAGIGQDVRGSYNSDIRQPVFSVLVKNAKPGKCGEFVRILTDTLTALVRQGIGEKPLLAAINYFEFKYREADFGSYPKGLIYGMQMLSSWLYDEKEAFTLLEQGAVFEKLREGVKNGYFESLITDCLLENPHRAVVTLKPDPALNGRMEEELAGRLAEKLAALGTDELKELRQEQERLKLFQETPSTEEELAKIPMLSIADIGRETQQLPLKEERAEGLPLLYHEVFTNGIAYIRLMFDAGRIPEEQVPYLGLLSTALGYVDSEHYTYGEFSEEMLLSTGGITTDVFFYTKPEKADDYRAFLGVKARALYAQMGRAFELIEEMLFATWFEDEKRMKEILAETVSRMQIRLEANGNMTALTRGLSYVSASGRFRDEIQGVAQFRFLKDLLEHFPERKEELFRNLNEVAAKLFTAANLLVSVTAEEEGHEEIKRILPEFCVVMQKAAGKPRKGCRKAEKSEMPGGRTGAEGNETQEDGRVRLAAVRRNEVFRTPGQVQYVARVGNFAKEGYSYTGALQVFSSILNYDYLWNELRVKGGAYGCRAGFGMDGDSYFVSYRDPNLAATDRVYENIPDYARNFEAGNRDMAKYIIGTISSLDAPRTPAMKGARALSAYLSGITREDYQRERDEILAAGQEEIRKLAGPVEAILKGKCRCALAGESRIRQEGNFFDRVESLGSETEEEHS